MYKIIINTNKYSGNWVRPFIAYSFGKLANSDGFTAYARPFWDAVVGTGVESYKNYLLIKDGFPEINNDDALLKRFLRLGYSKEDALLKVKEINKSIAQKRIEEDILRIYDEFLCFTNQDVDDWEEVTFYNIFNYESGDATAVYVQLNLPLTEYFENIIIPRIKKFFELDIYNRIKNYEYLCMFDEINRPQDERIELKDLILVDSGGNIIKNYLD